MASLDKFRFVGWRRRHDARSRRTPQSDSPGPGRQAKKEEAPKRLQIAFYACRSGEPMLLQKTDRISNHLWMQVSAVAIVHSSRPVNTGSSTFLPSMSWIMTVG